MAAGAGPPRRQIRRGRHETESNMYQASSSERNARELRGLQGPRGLQVLQGLRGAPRQVLDWVLGRVPPESSKSLKSSKSSKSLNRHVEPLERKWLCNCVWGGTATRSVYVNGGSAKRFATFVFSSAVRNIRVLERGLQHSCSRARFATFGGSSARKRKAGKKRTAFPLAQWRKS
jgi:hypothetical protein